MVVVYIASPYTIGDVAFNVRRQLEMSDRLMSLGYCPVAPLLTHFQHLCFPRPYEDWMLVDLEMISRCDVLLRMEGESSGADREVAHALSIGIPVVYSVDELTSQFMPT
jgi:hypothetical protein